MEKKISNIIFSTNRPLQCQAYIESLYRNMPKDLIQTYILYKRNRFHEQYSALFKKFPKVIVIEEQDFLKNFTHLLEQINTKYVLFATDDVVYFDSVDFDVIDRTFDRFPKDIFGFSLRLSPDMLKDSGDNFERIKISDQTVHRINWPKAKSKTARYPFELNSTFYKPDLIRKILKPIGKSHPLLKNFFAKRPGLVKFLKHFISMKYFLVSLESFHNPNTLEGHTYQWCKRHTRKIPENLYFQKLCSAAIQINRVNTTIDNPVDGLVEHTVESLNEKYKQGYRFDTDILENNKPKTTHVGREYFKLIKK